MKKHSIWIVSIFMILFNLQTTILYADGSSFDESDFPDFPFENDPGQPAATPIDDWIPFILILSIGFIFYATYKKKKIKS